MKIDWLLAPEWAIAHGLKATGMGIKECWLGDEMHQQLDQQKAFLYGGNGHHESGYFYNSSRDSFSYVTQRPASWTGAGLPPVGVLIEMKHKNATESWARPDFTPDMLAWVGKKRFMTADEKVGDIDDYLFRPILTPEQIAAEERGKAIAEMVHIAHRRNLNAQDIVTAPYDAGYRKQVKP